MHHYMENAEDLWSFPMAIGDVRIARGADTTIGSSWLAKINTGGLTKARSRFGEALQQLPEEHI